MIKDKDILVLTLSEVRNVIGQERWLIYKELEKNYNAKIKFVDVESDIDLRKFQGIILLEEPIWFRKFKKKPPRLNFGANRPDVIVCSIVSDFQIQIFDLIKFHKRYNYQVQFHNHEGGISFLRKYFPGVSFHHIPMHVSEKCFYDEKIVKDVCILDTVQGHPLTPLRNRISNICRSNFKQETTILSHPGKRVGSSSHNEYSDLLKRSVFTIACTTVYGISVRKYHEAGCAASTIIGDHTGFSEHDIIENNLIFVSPTSSDEDIHNTISNALASQKCIENRAIKTYPQYIENYRSGVVASQILSGIYMHEFRRAYDDKLATLLASDAISARILRRAHKIKERLKMIARVDQYGL